MKHGVFFRLCGLLGWLWSSAAAAVAQGTPPELVVQETVFGSSRVIGNTLMAHNGALNFALRENGSSANLRSSDFPPDAEVVRAFLFWSGSVDALLGADREVDFRLPDGTFFDDLSVDFPSPGESPSALNRCIEDFQLNANPGDVTPAFFTCRREVTELLQRMGPGGAIGNYLVSDVTLQPGNDDVGNNRQAMYGGWALAVMWESPTHPVRRDLLLYDGFYLVDERENAFTFSSGLSEEFELTGFRVGPTGDAEFTFMGFEGDQPLGVPPQNLQTDANLFCTTCNDFIEIRRDGSTDRVRMQDANNDPGNLFNGSNNSGGGPHPGLDIDTFDIGTQGLGAVQSNDTRVFLRVGSGDGQPGPNNRSGGGELVFLGMSMLSIDTFSPRFSNTLSEKVVLETVAGPGETLNYILRVFNDGSATAAGTVLRDRLPSGVTYVPNSTTNTCGVNSADTGGQSPILTDGGLNIGNVESGARCEVRFKVLVNSNVTEGTVLNNYFTISAVNHPNIEVGPATTVIETAQIGQPTKSVSVIGAGDPIPGASLTYTIRIPNNGARAAPQVRVIDNIPAEIEVDRFIGSLPSGSVNQSNFGNGRIDVSNLTVPPNGFIELNFLAKIRDGVTAGTAISNQATIEQPSLPAPLVSDDPTTSAVQDPTVLIVAEVPIAIDLSASTKSVTDVNGGRLEPGDVLEYRIAVTQSGGTFTTVQVNDDLPAFVGGCTIVDNAGGFASCQPGGAQGTGLVFAAIGVPANATRELVFRATVNADAPDRTQITNLAFLSSFEDPTVSEAVRSPTLEVFHRALFDTSTKTVLDVNGGDVRSGDTLEYTIRVINSGNRRADNLVVIDEVPAGLANIAIENGGVLAGNSIRWTAPVLPAGDELVLAFSAQVARSLAGGTRIENRAQISADPPAEAFTTAPAISIVRGDPELRIEKRVRDLNGGDFAPNDVVEYTLEVENVGSGSATNVAIRDPISTAFSRVTLVAGGRQVGSELLFDETSVAGLASLSAGGTILLRFQAQLAASLPEGLRVSNQAFGTLAELNDTFASDDPSTPTPNDSTDFVVTSRPELSLTKTFTDKNGGNLEPGDIVEFVLTLRNTGNAPANDVVVRDPLDARLSFVQSTQGIFENGAVFFRATRVPLLSVLNPNTDVTMRFDAVVALGLADGTEIPNQASAASENSLQVASDDPTTPDFPDPTMLVIVAQPLLSPFTKIVEDLDGDGVFEPGDRIRYTIEIVNSGTDAARNVLVNDSLPEEISDWVAGQGGTVVANSLRWNRSTTPSLARLASGQSIQLTVEGTINRPLDNDTIISNQARVRATGLDTVFSDDPNTPDVDDATRFVVRSHPRLEVQKIVADLNGAPTEPGDPLRYRILVRNLGDRAARNVTVEDPIDENLVNIIPSNGGVLNSGLIRWAPSGFPSLARIEIDQEVVLQFDASIRAPLSNGTVIENQALVSIGENGVPGSPFLSDDPSTPAPLDPTKLQAVSASDLSASTLETLDSLGNAISTRRPGSEVFYELRITNGGQDVAQNVDVLVELPAEVEIRNADGGLVSGQTVRFSSQNVPGLSRVAPGQILTFSIETLLSTPLPNGRVLIAQATIAASNFPVEVRSDDPSTVAFGDPTQLIVESAADISTVEKTFVDLNGGLVEPGDLIEYILRFENRGDDHARNVVVIDPLPRELVFDSSSTQGRLEGEFVLFEGPEVDALAEVEPFSPIELRFRTSVRNTLDDGTVVSNQARLSLPGVSPVLSDDPTTAQAADPTNFEVVAVPKLLIEKSVQTANGTRQVAPLEELVYSVVIRSIGTARVPSGTFVDVLPSSLGEVQVSSGLQLNESNGTLSAVLPALRPGDERRFRYSAQVRPDTANGTRIRNQAQITVANLGLLLSDDPSTEELNDPTEVLVEAFPDLSSAMKRGEDIDGPPLLPGDAIRYTIRIDNTGNGSARQLQIRDPIDLESLRVVEIGQGGQLIDGVIRWDETTSALLNVLRAGESVEVDFVAAVKDGVVDGTTIENQAQINTPDVPASIPTDDPFTDEVDDATELRVETPLLVMKKRVVDLSVPFDVFAPNDQVRYELVIENIGSATATFIQVEDLLPDGLEAVRLSNNGLLDNQIALWDAESTPALAALDVGRQITLQVTGILSGLLQNGEEVINQAQLRYQEFNELVLSDDPDTEATNDATSITIRAAETYEGVLEALDDASGMPLNGVVRKNQTFRVQLSFTNQGTQSGLNGVIEVPLDFEMWTFLESANGGVVVPEENLIRWDSSTTPALTQILPTDLVTIDFTARLSDSVRHLDEFDLRALLQTQSTSERFEFGPVTLRAQTEADLRRSTKEIIDENGGSVLPGDVLTYRITVFNDSIIEAESITIVDSIPPGTAYVTGSTRKDGEPVEDDGTASPLQSGLDIGGLRSGEEVRISFQVQVGDFVVSGSEISNQAILRIPDQADTPTDDPRTQNVVGDPTIVIVGGGENVLFTKTATPEIATVGDTIRFEIGIENTGDTILENIRVTDAINEPASYIAGSIQLDGITLTDEEDSDPVTVFVQGGTAFELAIDRILPRESHVLTFEAEVLEGFFVQNQAFFSADNFLQTPSDADVAIPGNQPTVVPISNSPEWNLNGSAIVLEDSNGGDVQPTDLLQGRLLLRNASAFVVSPTRFVLDIPQEFDVDGAANNGAWAWNEVTRKLEMLPDVAQPINTNDTFSLPFKIGVASGLEAGSVIRVTGSGSFRRIDVDDTQELELESEPLVVGSSAGTSTLRGRLFIENENLDGEFTADVDEPAVGFSVQISSEGETEPVANITTNEDGAFDLSSIPAGKYSLSVRSSTGAVYIQGREVDLEPGAVIEVAIQVQPTGTIYQSNDATPLEGTEVWLYIDDNDDDPSNDVLVPAEELPAGQQGQSSTERGFYRFDPPPGQYRIGLKLSDALLSFPSTLIVPQGGVAGFRPFGAQGESISGATDQERLLSATVAPNVDEPSVYYLRFSIDDDSPLLFNNHIPVDRLTEQLRLTKTANRKQVRMGDLIAYTVRLENPSMGEFRAEDGGGILFVDRLPEGFRLIEKAWQIERIETDINGQIRRFAESDVRINGRETLSFGPLHLRPRASYELRYQAVVAPGTPQGSAENRVEVNEARSGNPLTPQATASVTVVPDSMFELGSIRVKAFCDDNEDGLQNSGESGVGGIRAYLDTGHFVETDVSGKAHFSLVPPGMHLIKIDERTLLPGLTIRGDGRKNVYLSPGLPAQVAFTLQCDVRAQAPDQVKINPAAYAPVGKLAQETLEFNLSLDPKSERLVIDSHSVHLPRAALALGTQVEQPVFFRSEGPNLNPELADAPWLLEFVPKWQSDWSPYAWQITVYEEHFEDSLPTIALDSKLSVATAGIPEDFSTEPPAIREPRQNQTATDAGASEDFASEPNATVGDGGMDVKMNVQDASDAGDLQIDGGPGDNEIDDAGMMDAGGTDDEQLLATASDMPAETPVIPVLQIPAKKQIQRKSVYVFSGIGSPPPKIQWNGKDPVSGETVLQAGNRYGVVLSLMGPQGDEVFSAAMPFGVGYDGDLFTGASPPYLRVEDNDLILLADGVLDTTFSTRAQERIRFELGYGAMGGSRIAVPAMLLVGDNAASPVDEPASLVEVEVHREQKQIVIEGKTLDVPSFSLGISHAPGRGPNAEGLNDDPNDRSHRFDVILPTEEGWKTHYLIVSRVVDAQNFDVNKAKTHREFPDLKNWNEDVLTEWLKATGSQLGLELISKTVGVGAPAQTLVWEMPESGLDDSVMLIAELVLVRNDETTWISAPTYFGRNGSPDGDPESDLMSSGNAERIVIPNSESDSGGLSDEAMAALQQLAASRKTRPERILIESHTDDRGPRLMHRTRTQQLAEAAKRIFIESGLDAAQVSALGVGSDRPNRPNMSESMRAKNRRLEIQIEKPKSQSQDPPTGAASSAMQCASPGATSTSTMDGCKLQIKLTDIRSFQLSLRNADGTLVLVPQFPKSLFYWEGPADSAPRRQMANEASPATVDQAEQQSTQKSSAEASSVSIKEEDSSVRFTASAADAEAAPLREPASIARDGRGVAATADGGSEGSNAEADFDPSDGGVLDGGDASARTGAADGAAQDFDAGALEVEDGGHNWEDAANVDAPEPPAPLALLKSPLPFSGTGTTPDWWPSEDMVPAARTRIHLPNPDTPLRTNILWVHGQTEAKNQVTINGIPVSVRTEDGKFSHLVKLSRDDAALEIVVTDAFGNEARYERALRVESDGWFVLALADTVVGGDGAKLGERMENTSFNVGDVFLYGRAVAYVKGQFQGKWLFKNYDLTLHMDTRRWQDDAFARDLLNPVLNQPVFGDSSLEVQEARARYPLYLSLQADDSRVEIGNLRTGIENGDLLRFDRARYGAMLSFDRGWLSSLDVAESDEESAVEAAPSSAADPWRTRVQAFVVGGPSGQRHARVELMGTGGSAYFLRHQFVIEGTEKVSLLVRDAVTGSVIARVPQSRNYDYTIRYQEGRLLFHEPIPAFTDMAFTLNHNLHQANPGHRIFVEVEYEHSDEQPLSGVGAGLAFQQRLTKHLEVGGGYIHEGREAGAPGYQLGGAHARLIWDDSTYVQAEWAWSRSVDAGNFLSLDGGLTYQNFGQSLEEQPARIGSVEFPTDRQGHALKLEGKLGFGHWLGRDVNDGSLRAYYQNLAPGFFSGASILEQGQTKWGTDSYWNITDDDRLMLRYDSVISEIPELPHVTEYRTLARHLVMTQYQRKLGAGVVAQAEYGYGFTSDSGSFGASSFAEEKTFHSNAGALALDWQMMERLSVGVRQEVILSGDPTLLQAWNDHLVSHFNARYALNDAVAVTANQSLRWNGENQSSLGLSWKVSDQARVYANERFGFARQGFTNSTVVGGETEIGENTRAYAEYQLQSAFAAPNSRALVGLANRWKLPFGLLLSLGYERTQTFGDDGQNAATAGMPPAAFTDGTFYAAPGVNGAGSYFYGAGSRDAVSGVVEWRLKERIQASQKLEVRLDRFDPKRAGHDRNWVLSATNAVFRLSDEMALLARYNLGLAYDLMLGRREAYLEEGIFGAAYRPVSHDWISVVTNVSRRVEVRPLSLEGGSSEDYSSHALSVEPIVELPWNVQLVAKGALKHTSQQIDSLPRADAWTTLALSRVNWHSLAALREMGIDSYIPGELDLGIEYRMLAGWSADRLEHGMLLEAQYAPVPYFRMGVGWNFTRFSDQMLSREDEDHSGFFLRAVGQY